MGERECVENMSVWKSECVGERECVGACEYGRVWESVGECECGRV